MKLPIEKSKGPWKKGKKVKESKTYKIEFNDKKTTGHYPNIISVQLDPDTSFTYYKNPQNLYEWGSELYIGKNYNVGSDKPSYSRVYKRWVGLPEKYKKTALDLREIHREHYN